MKWLLGECCINMYIISLFDTRHYNRGLIQDILGYIIGTFPLWCKYFFNIFLKLYPSHYFEMWVLDEWFLKLSCWPMFAVNWRSHQKFWEKKLSYIRHKDFCLSVRPPSGSWDPPPRILKWAGLESSVSIASS